MQIDQVVEQLVDMMRTDHQEVDAQCRSFPQSAGPRPAKADDSGPPPHCPTGHPAEGGRRPVVGEQGQLVSGLALPPPALLVGPQKEVISSRADEWAAPGWPRQVPGEGGSFSP